MRRLLLVVAALVLAGCGGDVANSFSAPSAPAAQATDDCTGGPDPTVTSPGQEDDFNEGANLAGNTLADGLKIIDISPGNGGLVSAGQCLTMQYTGWLTDGTKFDSSRNVDVSGSPKTAFGFRFRLGQGQVIQGWDEGIPGMRIGGRRRLVIPPALAYKDQARGPIPANATLIFIVEAVKAH